MGPSATNGPRNCSSILYLDTDGITKRHATADLEIIARDLRVVTSDRSPIPDSILGIDALSICNLKLLDLAAK